MAEWSWGTSTTDVGLLPGPAPQGNSRAPEDCLRSAAGRWCGKLTLPLGCPMSPPPINPGRDEEVREWAVSLRREYKNQGAPGLQRCGAGGLDRPGVGRSILSSALCSIVLLKESFASAPLRTQGRAGSVQGHQVRGVTLGCVPPTGGRGVGT